MAYLGHDVEGPIDPVDFASQLCIVWDKKCREIASTGQFGGLEERYTTTERAQERVAFLPFAKSLTPH
jgi:hypothetical protein